MSWETFQFGQIFLDDEPQLVPDFPTTDIPEYFGPKSIDIKDAQDEEPITWINPVGTNLLVADRVLLTMVSWDDLDEQGFVKGKEVHIGGKSYRCRLLQVGDTEGVPNEWDAILGTTTDDNGIWHWKNIWFWGMDAVKDMPSDRVIRECDNWSDAPAAERRHERSGSKLFAESDLTDRTYGIVYHSERHGGEYSETNHASGRR